MNFDDLKLCGMMNQWCWQKYVYIQKGRKMIIANTRCFELNFDSSWACDFVGYTCHRKKQSRRKTCALSHSPGIDIFFHLAMIVCDFILKFTLSTVTSSVNGCFLLLNTCSHRLPECVLPLMSFKGWVNPFCLPRVPVCVQHGRGLEVIFGNFGHCPEAL